MHPVPPIAIPEPREASALQLQVRQSSAPDEVALTVIGELDRSAAPALAARLDQLLDADTAATTLSIDLTRAPFLDAGGLAVLLSAAERATASGRALRLTGCHRLALRVIRVTGVSDAFAEVVTLERECSRSGRSPKGAPGTG
jgi:RNA polymerase sigma-B factor